MDLICPKFKEILSLFSESVVERFWHCMLQNLLHQSVEET